MDAGARAHIDHIIGETDGVFIMFHDQHGVAQIAQAFQRGEQAIIVALVQADGRFIEHIEHAGQAGADLRGEADALGLAARERAGFAIEVEIIEADIVEEAEAFGDFLEDAIADGALFGREMIGDAARPAKRLADGAANCGGDGFAGDLDAERFGAEAIAVADFAGGGGLVPLQLLADHSAFGIEALFEVADDAFEGFDNLIGLSAVFETQRDGAAAGAIEHGAGGFIRQIGPFAFQGEAIGAADAGQHLQIIRRGRVGFGPRRDGALFQRERVVGDNEIGIEMLFFAKTIAGRAGALRGVEGEQPRFNLGNGEAGDRAGEFFGEKDAALSFGRIGQRVCQFDEGEAFGQFQSGFEAFGEAGLEALLHRQPVYHHVDVVLVFLVERRGFLDGVELAVDLHAGEAVFLKLRQFLAILALAAAHDRSEQIEAGVFRQRHDAINHLADGLRRDRQAGGGRIGDADPRPQQAHIVVDLGDGGDGGARVLARRLLFDADRRGQALDMVNVRLGHHLQELAGVGGERLHIASLAFGIDGIKGEAGLAGTGQAGDHGERVLGQIDVDALEIMLPRAAHLDMVQHEPVCSTFVQAVQAGLIRGYEAQTERARAALSRGVFTVKRGRATPDQAGGGRAMRSSTRG